MSKPYQDDLYPLFCEIFENSDIPQTTIDTLFSGLCDAYSEDGRFYHTLEHLSDLAEEFDKYRAQFGNDTTAVLIALFYHDIVYNCVPGKDEQDSAEAMMGTLNGLIHKDILDRANEIILYTANHKAPENDHTAGLFLDMDMAILGATPEKYARYLHNVTQEFCTAYGITPDEFKQKRAELFLKPTIENEGRIFTTDEYSPIENRAIQNIRSELNDLQNTASQSPEP